MCKFKGGLRFRGRVVSVIIDVCTEIFLNILSVQCKHMYVHNVFIVSYDSFKCKLKTLVTRTP